MAIGNTDIDVSCDDCGESVNVDVTNRVIEALKKRGWRCHAGGESCPKCHDKDNDAIYEENQ